VPPIEAAAFAAPVEPVAPAAPKFVADSTGPTTNPFATIGVEIPANTGSTPKAPFGGSGKPSQGLIWGIGSGAAVVLVGLMVWFFALGGLNFNFTPTSPAGVQVTDVTGVTYDQGVATLTSQGLLISKVYEVSDTVPVDTIIRTDPVAGTAVPENTLITIYVSSGKNTVRVPSLVDLTEADAQALLVSLKLTLGTITQSNSASAAAGKVISSDPVLNAEVPEGTAINLVVSNGKVTVPDVRNLDISDARSILTAPDVGFTVSISTAEECLGTQGTVVLDQSVLPGLAPQKSAVVLTVACNP
jgi:serine/threonine-protein kinase